MAYKADINKKTVKKKIEQVHSGIADMKKFKTVAMLDLRRLPTALFQNLRKRIRTEGGEVLVLKKPVISRILESNKKLADRAKECDKPVALIYTNMTPFEINSFFKTNRKKRAAKVGEEAVFEIIVPEGETDLPAGPALSELKAAGLNVAIKAGKIAINRDSTVAKAGEKLTAQKVKALQTLGVMPFETMASMIFAYDGEYIYSKEILDIGDTIQADLAYSISQAVNLSINSGTYSSSSIEQLLVSAIRQSSALDSLSAKKEG
jgi:large subunit ribosomal protein L10